MRFGWNPVKADENIGNHNVTFEEACEVFLDTNGIEAFDAVHSQDEPRYIRIGLSSRRILTVIFTETKDDVTWIISARRATAKEKQLYEKEN